MRLSGQVRYMLVIMQVTKPSLLTSPFFPFLALGVLSLGAAAAYQLYYAPFMKNLLIWSAGAIVIYWCV